MINIPPIPWKTIEKILYSIGKGKDKIDYEHIIGKAKLHAALSYLQKISFITENNELTEIGKKFYTELFVCNDEIAYDILADSLKKTESVQLICQILWGRKNLTKNNIYNLLLIERMIDEKFKEDDLGSFLSILNKCKILNYSKKSGIIEIIYNPKNNLEESTTLFLSPDTPYSNIKALREAIRTCRSFIWWFDKHFSIKGLEPLSDELNGNIIDNIRVLTGTANVNDNLKKDFKRFETEMSKRGIKAELKVIYNKELLNTIHDRWIISENICYNLPPINTIYQGQYAEIKLTKNTPPFENWWTNSHDILLEWEEIKKHIVEKK